MKHEIEESVPDFDEIDYEEISDFFTRTGAVELISLLDKSGHRFDEIDDLLDAGRGTIHKRRDEAYGLGLIIPQQSVRDGGLRRVFILTAVGEEFKREMRRLGLTQSHERLRNIRLEYEQYKETFVDWTADSDSLQEDVEEGLNRRLPGTQIGDDDNQG